MVSIPTYCGVLKIFENCALNSRKRVSLRGKILVNDISNNRLPGPSMLLRRASPNGPDGVTKAAVLNHSAIDGLGRLTGCPGTTSARTVPLVPWLTSSTLPRTRGVKGNPDAMVQSPLQFQSPRMTRSGLLPDNQRRSWPKGSSHK